MTPQLSPLDLPKCLAQMLAFAWRSERLPEAAGPRAGVVGTGPPLRLLVLGDSSGAGVGVAHQDQALIGQMLVHLAPAARVQWELRARSGATTSAARRMLAGAGPVDVAVLALGVNDVLRLTRTARYRAETSALIRALRTCHGARMILASGVPPLGAFTAFPQPLRRALGLRAARLDAILRARATELGAFHVPFDMAPAPHWLARDGFHPGAALYAEWGARMAGLALRAVS